MRVPVLWVLGLLAVPWPLHAHSAEVENIPPGQYVPIALREIRQARRSIHLTMYLIALPSARRGSAVHQLVDALVEARRRGVAVSVLLDQNIAWTDDRRVGAASPTGKNAAAAASLQAQGIAVAFDDEAVYTHAKVLIIDEATVLLGSTNWTETAVTRNVEGTVLVRSPELARELVAQFAGVARASPPALEGPTLRVAEAFLTDPDHLGQMVRRQDEWAFDLYLALLRHADAPRSTSFTVASAPLVAAMGLTQTWVPYQRYTVRQVLSRLRDRYALLTYEAPRGRDLTIHLAPAAGDRFVSVPMTYWTWGWDRRLTFDGKVMYWLSQWYAAQSSSAPTWFRSQQDLAARHGISTGFIHNGMMTLRRHNLIEVEPSVANPADYGDRQANRYTPNALYDPETLAKALAALEQEYGRDRVMRARRHAAVVYEDADVGAITRLLVLEQEFGRAVVQRAVAKVGALSGSNPKRTVGYLVRTIQGMGTGQ